MPNPVTECEIDAACDAIGFNLKLASDALRKRSEPIADQIEMELTVMAARNIVDADVEFTKIRQLLMNEL